MHRTKTRFAARINHVASSLEKRGVRATYSLHDRVLSNRSSRRHFAGSAPELDDVQQRIISELAVDGYCVIPFSELIPEPAAWSAIEARAGTFVAETEASLAGNREALRVRAGKEFVVRLLSYGVELGLDDPWFATCASHRMLDVANTYLGLWSKLEYVDMWYSVPQPADADRIASQRWHRDFNDKHLLKAFLYLVDVDEGTARSNTCRGARPAGATVTPGRGDHSARTTRRTASWRSESRTTASARSPRQRGRWSSATPRASIGAASPPSDRGFSRRQRTPRPRRSRRSPNAATATQARSTGWTLPLGSRSPERRARADPARPRCARSRGSP